MPVLLQNRQRAVAINSARLRRTAAAILSAVRNKDAELSLLLVSDRRMRALNHRFRNKDKTTDVLAFPLYDHGPVPHPYMTKMGPPLCKGRQGGVEPACRFYLPSPSLQRRGSKGDFLSRKGRSNGFPPVLLGDVVVSMQTARRQAAERGHGLFDEVVRLVVHGVLHLLGYDHERSLREATRMARKERAILRRIR